MSKIHISNNLGKVGDKPMIKICRDSQNLAPRSRPRAKVVCEYGLRKKTIKKE